MAILAIFLYVVFASFSAFSQEKEEKTAVSVNFGVGSVQHEWDTGESEFHHPISFASLKLERKLGKKVYGCFEVLGQFALTRKSPNKGERLELGGCLVYKPTKTVKVETSFTNYRMRDFSVRKFAVVVSKEWELREKVSTEAYNNLMIFSGSDKHHKTGFLNKVGISTTFKPSRKVKVVGDFSLGGDNAPLEFKKPTATLFLKLRAEKKITAHSSVFGEWRYSKPFTDTRHTISSFQAGMNFHFGF